MSERTSNKCVRFFFQNNCTIHDLKKMHISLLYTWLIYQTNPTSINCFSWFLLWHGIWFWHIQKVQVNNITIILQIHNFICSNKAVIYTMHFSFLKSISHESKSFVEYFKINYDNHNAHAHLIRIIWSIEIHIDETHN